MTALLLTGCSASGDEPQLPVEPTETALTFAPAIPTAARSRAALQEVSTDFAVVAWKEVGGERQYVLRHADETPYQVRYFGDEWIYDIQALEGTQQYLRYWDLSASNYTFAAYAPYSVYDTEKGAYVTASEKHSISIDSDGRVDITGIQGNVADISNAEWLVALHRRDASPLADHDELSPATEFPALTSLTQSVPLVFHHIMSQVEFRAYNLNGTAIVLSSVDIELVTEKHGSTPSNIITTADYVGSDWVNPTAYGSKMFSGSSIGVTSASAATATPLATLVEIPQGVGGKWIKVKVKIDTKEFKGYFQLPEWADAEHTVPYVWEPDKKYIYTFALQATQEIILADISVEDFQWRAGNDIDVPEDEINW